MFRHKGASLHSSRIGWVCSGWGDDQVGGCRPAFGTVPTIIFVSSPPARLPPLRLRAGEEAKVGAWRQENEFIRQMLVVRPRRRLTSGPCGPEGDLRRPASLPIGIGYTQLALHV